MSRIPAILALFLCAMLAMAQTAVAGPGDEPKRSFDQAEYERVKGLFDDTKSDFSSVIPSKVIEWGSIVDKNAGLRLMQSMQPVFYFVYQDYDIEEGFEDKYMELQNRAMQRLQPLVKVMRIEWNIDNRPVIFWACKQQSARIFDSNELTLDAMEQLVHPRNPYAVIREASNYLDAYKEWIRLEPAKAPQIYKNLVKFRTRLSGARDTLLGMTMKFAPTNSDTTEDQIRLMEKRALYAGWDKFQGWFDEATGSPFEVPEIVTNRLPSGLLASVQFATDVFTGIQDIIEVLEIIDTELDNAWDVSSRILLDYDIQEVQTEYESWERVIIGFKDGKAKEVIVPSPIHAKIVEIKNLITEVDGLIDMLAQAPTFVYPGSVVKGFNLTGGAYADITTQEPEKHEVTLEELDNGNGIMAVPDGASLVYTLTSSGLLAAPEFFDNVNSVIIDVDGEFPSGYKGARLRRDMNWEDAGYVYSDDVFELGKGESTSTGKRWIIDLTDSGNGIAWDPEPDAGKTWPLPWKWNDGLNDHFQPVVLEMDGDSSLLGFTTVKIKAVRMRLVLEHGDYSGKISRTTGQALQGEARFLHEIDYGDNKTHSVIAKVQSNAAGSYTAALPAGHEYTITVDNQVCTIIPSTLQAETTGGSQNILVGTGRPVGIELLTPAFTPPQSDDGYYATHVAENEATITGKVDLGCSLSSPSLKLVDLSGKKSTVSIGLSAVQGTEGQYTFSRNLQNSLDEGQGAFKLELYAGSDLLDMLRFVIDRPRTAKPHIYVGDGYTTYSLNRLETVGHTVSLPLRLHNMGKETPGIAYLSLSASPGLEIVKVAEGSSRVNIDPTVRGQAGNLSSGFVVGNYPAGGVIWDTEGNEIEAQYQLVDLRATNAPAGGVSHEFTVTLRVNAQGVKNAQWFQYRAAFKESEQDAVEDQNLYPVMNAGYPLDQQGFPVLRAEAEPPEYVEDAFPDDPAASVDSDGDGHPDFWDPTATPEQIAASNLTLDAYPHDATKWNADVGGKPYEYDAFPNDPAASVDSDGDGCPDFWDPTATRAQILNSTLVIDAYRFDPLFCRAITGTNNGPDEIRAAEYYIDSDPGQGKGVSIAPVDEFLDAPFEHFKVYNVGTRGLATGLHTVYVRARDSDGNWSPLGSAKFLIKEPSSGHAHPYHGELRLTAAEYYIDTDPGQGRGTPIIPRDGTFDQPFEYLQRYGVSTTGLEPGVHTLYVRVKQDSGEWSATQSAVFHVQAPEFGNAGVTDLVYDRFSCAQFDITRGEFFIHSDPGVGQGIPAAPQDGIFDSSLENLVGEAVMPSLRPASGRVLVGFRARDEQGRWSETSTALVDYDRDGDGVADAADAFPDDPAASRDTDGDGRPDNWNANATQEQIEASNLILDAYPEDPDNWDLPSDVSYAEYYIDSDPGQGKGLPVLVRDGSTPAHAFAGLRRFELDTTGLEPGVHRIHVRVRNGEGVWSPLSSAAFEVVQPMRNDREIPLESDHFADAQPVVAAEYYLGNDPGPGKGTAIDLGSSSAVSLTSASISLDEFNGIKKIGVRVKRQDGTWSPAQEVMLAAVMSPTVSTTAIADITSDSAASGGEISDDGGAAVTARGVCWSTEKNPTVDDDKTTDGTGTGAFESAITDLAPGQVYYVRAYATNSRGTGYGEQRQFKADAVLPTVTTALVSNINSNSAKSGGEVTDDGGAAVFNRGVCWSIIDEPTILHYRTQDGTGTGAFTSSLQDLTPGDTYYVRAYAVNALGVSYGETRRFTAASTLPSVATGNVNNINATDAVAGGNVSSDGGATVTARGLCWSTSKNPTINDSKSVAGSGAGWFSSSITGLTPAKTYYIRAYATNANGTQYGAQKQFTTRTGLASVTSGTVSNITSTSAVSGGNVANGGGAAVTARGLCWAPTFGPTIANSKTVNGSGLGAFSGKLTGLRPGLKYFVRAYATTDYGTSYGVQQVFTALAVLPEVTTAAVTAVTTNSAESGGEVTSSGGAIVTEKGVCWSTRRNPTIADSKTTNGPAIGKFISKIKGLQPNTTYYLRAYATNAQGTAYGEEKEFRTGGATSGVPDGVLMLLLNN